MLRCQYAAFRSRKALLSSISSEARSGNKPNDAEIDPLSSYTIFGTIRKPKRSPFFYTDRKSGNGYSNFSNTVYWHRPYIWPPLRKWFNLNFVVALVGLLLLSIDYGWFLELFKSVGKRMKPEASQQKHEVPNTASDSDGKVVLPKT